MNTIQRYTDQELELFRITVEQKLEKALVDLDYLFAQLQELAEVMEEEGDWMDSTSNSSEMEMLHTMINRQQRHIRDIENALVRIKNKTYGICIVTGELIDKRRLLAVPTTTKSLAAKTILAKPKAKQDVEPKPKAKGKREPVILSRVITPKAAPAPSAILPDDDDEEDDDLYEDFNTEDNMDIRFLEVE